MQSAFKDSSTDFSKGPPSTTAIHQPCDRNKSFRDCKRGMKTVTEAGTDTSNRTLEINMRQAFKDLRGTFPEINMVSAMEDKMVKAAEVISYVQKSSYTNSRKHVISYQVIAPHCLLTTLHCTAHNTAPHYIQRCTALHSTTLHGTTLHCIALHTTLHCIQHCTVYNTALDCIRHCAAWQSTALYLQ